MSNINLDIDLDSLLTNINKYEHGIIKRINHFINLYDKQEKEDYIWRCVDLLRNDEFIDGVDVIKNYLDEIIDDDSKMSSYDFMYDVIQVIYGTDNFNTGPINGRFYGSCKEYDKDKVRALFDEHGDTLIKLTHMILFELFWWDDIDVQFKNNLIKGKTLKKDAENFKLYFTEFPNKHLYKTSIIKNGPTDYYEVKIKGYGINDINFRKLGYKNKYGFTIDFGYNDFTFIHREKIEIDK